jgi:predicted short-subunit dehydrogenase-like oxidoreductase (DUF2520 family)
VAVARRIVRDLGAEAFPIRKAAKTLYHALGSFSSPLLVAALATAERVGRDSAPARRAASWDRSCGKLSRTTRNAAPQRPMVAR